MIISRIALVVGGIGGLIAAFALFSLINIVWLLPAARNEGRAAERATLDAATNKAIGELSDAADKARFTRRLCRERGGVYLNASGQCEQAKAQPDG